MAFQNALAAGSQGDSTGESDVEGETPQPDASGAESPFSMGYDLSSYEVDAETTDQLLGVLVAVTNLL